MAGAGNESGGSILTAKTPVFGQKLYVLVIATAVLTLAIFALLFLFLRRRWSSNRRRIGAKLGSGRLPLVCEEIGEIKETNSQAQAVTKPLGDDSSKKVFLIADVARGIEIEESESNESSTTRSESSSALSASTDGFVNLAWGRWYTLRELEVATNQFAAENVIGEGGYGVVYRGVLPDGSVVAVKNLSNKKGHAEKDFKVEVEAIGKVRHKNLVGLLGYCADGAERLLVYEYIDNGNLEQWLHGDVGPISPLTWDIRMKIAIGTARGLAYLHEGLEPKVIHRDIKSSNILLDRKWNAKVSDFGLAKILGSEKSYVTTRVMGTFGYVSPDYANTGMLNEGSDVYSFGILLMEIITGRSPIDYSRPPGEMNLVDWFRSMVSSRRGEDLVDPLIGVPPSPRTLKRILLVCLRCIDMDAYKRPKMGQIVHMLEADEFPYHPGHLPLREPLPLPPRVVGRNKILNPQKNDDEEERLGQR
ncbi:probable receptor-like serine/threonine-protein kinase At4g34500 isoform X1 [Andrographis paniculata]|uniref:probable receptor-like serine/threonine-protein kinase At4g34500 isoform X1 n=1 Tax=Andrographis paniculata TaxID=175694 RepID=UPI0021E98F1E|nr:probable receptor-like serine/threonine-protein kinase At4g34500 isoform X1 [Andrographis paniculata]